MNVATLKYNMSPECTTWNWKISGYELITGSVKRNWGRRPTLGMQTSKDLNLSSGRQRELSSRPCSQVGSQEKWKGIEKQRIKINIPSKKVTHLLVRMERLLRNWFGNSGSSNQKVYCICNKGTQIFYSDLAVNCTDKKSAIRSFWEIYKVAPCLKCSYEWRRSVRGFRSGCKLFITQALKVVCFCFVGIQKRLNLNNLSSLPVVSANLLFPKEAVCDWSLKQLLTCNATSNLELLSVHVLW